MDFEMTIDILNGINIVGSTLNLFNELNTSILFYSTSSINLVLKYTKTCLPKRN